MVNKATGGRMSDVCENCECSRKPSNTGNKPRGEATSA